MGFLRLLAPSDPPLLLLSHSLSCGLCWAVSGLVGEDWLEPILDGALLLISESMAERKKPVDSGSDFGPFPLN